MRTLEVHVVDRLHCEWLQGVCKREGSVAESVAIGVAIDWGDARARRQQDGYGRRRFCEEMEAGRGSLVT